MRRHMKMDAVSGTIRISRGFLLFPMRIGNEIRWLERACWKEEYCRFVRGLAKIEYMDWAPLEWIDDDDEEEGKPDVT